MFYYKDVRTNATYVTDHEIKNDPVLVIITKEEHLAACKAHQSSLNDSKRATKREIAKLKASLAKTDYVVIKIAEGSATTQEYAEVIARRREMRARINELEESI